ncbi:MAG TPA: DUF1622 domain-containing protein [Patescibacteria group bacterium]|nr:DUF1622 domain-containing protein [Patescibacteria group bacterium]
MIFDAFSIIVYNTGLAIEYIGVFVVVAAVISALYMLFFAGFSKDYIRIKFARNVMFGIEFIIAADILLVTVVQSLDEAIKLGGIILIRILLGYALRQEFLYDNKKLDKMYKK